jgi:uncharacterized membrane protein YeiB
MTHKEEQSRHWGPVLEKDRIATLDVLRGVAILAMLLANILIYAFPLKAPNMTTEGANPADQLVAMLLAFAAGISQNYISGGLSSSSFLVFHMDYCCTLVIS